MLPNPQHLPPQSSQATVGIAIPNRIRSEFLFPPIAIGSWKRAVQATGMPKATVHEHGQLDFSERHIGSPPRSWQPIVDPVSIAARMEYAPYRDFGFGIAPTLFRHLATDFLGTGTRTIGRGRHVSNPVPAQPI
jgi:hypothetical protein